MTSERSIAPEPPPNILLAGFMGTGKSTLGRALALRLNWDFWDTDDHIVARDGRSITDIFAESGEAAFRALEAAVCRDALASHQRVIATGGGALLDDETRAYALERALVIGLRCDLDVILRRVKVNGERPLFSEERDKLAARLAARAPVYDSLPHQLDTTHLTPEAAAMEVIKLWKTL